MNTFSIKGVSFNDKSNLLGLFVKYVVISFLIELFNELLFYHKIMNKKLQTNYLIYIFEYIFKKVFKIVSKNKNKIRELALLFSVITE